MIRPALTEVGIFLLPFMVYAGFLFATRTGLFVPQSWPLQTLMPLTAVALLLMIASLVLLAHFSGAPPDSVYVPAHVENGRLIPGRENPEDKR
jgi:hypothetical protein